MKTRDFIRALAALLLLAWASGVLAQMVLEVIPLRHRTVEEVIPVLQPMLVRDATISGMRGQLIVRTTPANLDEVRRILATLDVAARRLQISVAQEMAGDGRRRGAEISGSVRVDEELRLSVPGSGPSSREGIEARVFDRRSTENVRVLQTVQVLEGRSAYVSTGQSLPQRGRTVTRSVVGGRVVEQVVEGVDYRSADTGFYVTPRVSGDRVTLEVSAQREAPARRSGAVDVQRVGASVSGRLGEWLEIAAVSEERSSERDVLLGRAAASRVESRSVLLKVEEIR